MTSQFGRWRAASSAAAEAIAAVSEKLPDGDDADRPLAGGCVDVREVVGGQARGADHHRHAGLDRGERVALDRLDRRVVDQHVDAVERLGRARVDRRAVDLPAGRGAADRASAAPGRAPRAPRARAPRPSTPVRPRRRCTPAQPSRRWRLPMPSHRRSSPTVPTPRERLALRDGRAGAQALAPTRLLAAGLIDWTGTGFYLAISAIFLTRAVGLTPAQAGVALAGVGTVAFAGSVPLGRLADRAGQREVLLALLVARAAAFAALSTVPALPLTLGLLAVIGLADQAAASVTQALAGELVGPRSACRSWPATAP